MKGDEGILGDGDFVMNILFDADERLDRRYKPKSLGYDLDKVEQRVLEIYQLEREDLYSKGRERVRAEARGLKEAAQKKTKEEDFCIRSFC